MTDEVTGHTAHMSPHWGWGGRGELSCEWRRDLLLTPGSIRCVFTQIVRFHPETCWGGSRGMICRIRWTKSDASGGEREKVLRRWDKKPEVARVLSLLMDHYIDIVSPLAWQPDIICGLFRTWDVITGGCQWRGLNALIYHYTNKKPEKKLSSHLFNRSGFKSIFVWKSIDFFVFSCKWYKLHMSHFTISGGILLVVSGRGKM